MKIYSITFLTTALFLTGCSSSQPANQTLNTTTTNAANSTTTNAQSVNIAKIEEKLRALPPSEVLKEFFDAIKRKDVETAKKSLSKDSFPLLEQNSEELGVSVDQYLSEINAIHVDGDVQIKSEKILGNTATVEYKDSQMPQFIALPFVREENIWKISLDKLVADMEKKLAEDMKKPPANTK